MGVFLSSRPVWSVISTFVKNFRHFLSNKISTKQSVTNYGGSTFGNYWSRKNKPERVVRRGTEAIMKVDGTDNTHRWQRSSNQYLHLNRRNPTYGWLFWIRTVTGPTTFYHRQYYSLYYLCLYWCHTYWRARTLKIYSSSLWRRGCSSWWRLTYPDMIKPLIRNLLNVKWMKWKLLTVDNGW